MQKAEIKKQKKDLLIDEKFENQEKSTKTSDLTMAEIVGNFVKTPKDKFLNRENACMSSLSIKNLVFMV